MDSTESIMFDIYNALMKARYPKITTATVEDVGSTILKGENRIALLCWLLSEKSPSIASELKSLKGPDLEAKLLQFYSEIGICIDKKLLLGNCTLKEQLPTLRLLLNFIECMYIQSLDQQCTSKVSIDDILNDYIKEDANSGITISNIESKLSYAESLQYFDSVKEYVNKHEELDLSHQSEKECATENEAQVTEEQEKNNEDDEDLLLSFNVEKTKFIEAFSNIGSLVANTENINSLYSMDKDIEEICLNFSSLTKFLQAREEILNVTVPKGLNKMSTPLSEIVEDIVVSSEKFQGSV